MRIILHIGEGKTGTTSIQRALNAGRKMLLEKKMLYLPISGSPNQCWLNVPIGGAIRTNKETALQAVEDWFLKVDECFKKENIETLIISAETLFNHSADDILKLLKKHISYDSITVITYLRETGDYYLSLVQQVIKGKHNFSLPSTYTHNISKYLKGWFKSVGQSSLVLRNFNPTEMIDGSVVNDFSIVLSKITGINISLPDSGRVNESLTAEQMISLAEFRKLKLGNFDGTLHNASNALISLFHTINKNKLIPGSKPLLTTYAKNQIVFRNAKYFYELVELCPELAEDPTWDNWFQQCHQHSYKCHQEDNEFWGSGSDALCKLLASYNPLIVGFYSFIIDSVDKKSTFNEEIAKQNEVREFFDKIRSLKEYDSFIQELNLLKDNKVG